MTTAVPLVRTSSGRALGAQPGLAQVVEEEVDGRVRELARPLLRGRVEGDVDALEAVALELAAQERPQCLVEVRDRGVQRYVDDQRHVSRPYPSAAARVGNVARTGVDRGRAGPGTVVPRCTSPIASRRRPQRSTPQPPARTPAGPQAKALALQRAAGNRAARRVLSRWTKHPDPEQKGVMVPDSSAGEYTRFNPPKNE